MNIDIVPLSDGLGAEIRGIDLARGQDTATAAGLRDAWHRHVLLLFRDQDLDDAALKDSALWLGAPGRISMPVERRGDADTGIALVSNILDDAGQPIGALGDGDMWFHHSIRFAPFIRWRYPCRCSCEFIPFRVHVMQCGLDLFLHLTDPLRRVLRRG